LSSVTLAPNLLTVVDETGGLSTDDLPGDWPEAGTATAKAASTTEMRTFPRFGEALCRRR
jgi:hypothetical protein